MSSAAAAASAASCAFNAVTSSEDDAIVRYRLLTQVGSSSARKGDPPVKKVARKFRALAAVAAGGGGGGLPAEAAERALQARACPLSRPAGGCCRGLGFFASFCVVLHVVGCGLWAGSRAPHRTGSNNVQRASLIRFFFWL